MRSFLRSWYARCACRFCARRRYTASDCLTDEGRWHNPEWLTESPSLLYSSCKGRPAHGLDDVVDMDAIDPAGDR